MRRGIPYVITGVGLLIGLLVLLVSPLPTATLNAVVGWSSLAVAVASVAYLIVQGGDPGERGPDF